MVTTQLLDPTVPTCADMANRRDSRTAKVGAVSSLAVAASEGKPCIVQSGIGRRELSSAEDSCSIHRIVSSCFFVKSVISLPPLEDTSVSQCLENARMCDLSAIIVGVVRLDLSACWVSSIG